MRTAENGSEEMPRVTQQGRLGDFLVVFGCIPMWVTHFFIPQLWFMSPVRFMGDIDDMVDMVDMGYDSPPDAHPSGW